MSEIPATITFLAACLIFIAAGFLGADEFFLRKITRIRGKERLLDLIFYLFSWTPFVILILFFLPLLVLLTDLAFASALEVAATCSLALGISFAGKFLIGRSRPLNHLTYVGKIDSSFPSAHTAGSFAAAFAVASLIPELAATMLFLASVVALSRMYLEMHFWSDVAGGILVAYVAAIFIARTDFLNFWFNFLGIT